MYQSVAAKAPISPDWKSKAGQSVRGSVPQWPHSRLQCEIVGHQDIPVAGAIDANWCSDSHKFSPVWLVWFPKSFLWDSLVGSGQLRWCRELNFLLKPDSSCRVLRIYSLIAVLTWFEIVEWGSTILPSQPSQRRLCSRWRTAGYCSWGGMKGPSNAFKCWNSWQDG